MHSAFIAKPWTPERLWRGASRRLAREIPFRPFQLALNRPIVSFSFDDFPVSAALNAAPILEDANMRGTFYFADGLARKVENGQLIADRVLAADLGRRGHEIGAHTQGHIDVQRTPTSALRADIDANIAAISRFAPRPQSFAYPFGIVSLRAKLTLMHRFAGLRGITTGINHGVIDLAHLKAHELYDCSSTIGTLSTLLDEVERTNGWLIFYTHDVRRDPSDIGCSPQYFAAVVDLVRARRLEVATVARVLTQIGARR